MSDGKEKDPHWDESARNFIETVIVHVAMSPDYEDHRHLVQVRDLIAHAMRKPPSFASAEDEPPALYEEIKRNAEWLQDRLATRDIGSALLAGAMDFYSKSETEMAGVLSTVNRHTKFLDYAAFRNVLRDSDFDLGELKRNPKGVSVYLCFPATRAEISKRWMRLFVNQLLDAMDREKTTPAAPPRTTSTAASASVTAAR